MNLLKKFVSMFTVAVLVMSSGMEAFAGSSMDAALNKVNLYVKQEKGTQLLTWKGVIDADNFAPAVIVYKTEDGQELPAYCANPNKPGVENISAKAYNVDVDQLDTDPHVWGVITNGYPYKTPQELGVNTEYEAYYATKMAVWAIVHDNYSNLNDWKANGNQNTNVEKAMKNLVAKGLANQYVYTTWLATNPVTTSAQDKGDYLEQEYELKSNVDIVSFRVKLDGNVPTGTKVTDENGQEKETFDGSTKKIKVRIPKTGGEQDGSFRIILKAKLENKSVMFGLSHDNKQDYYVAPLPSYNGDSWADVVYGEGAGEPDNPDIPQVGKGLQILKVKEGTTKGLAGAVFKVEVDGKTIGHYVSDKNGEILIPDITGTVSITEEVPPLGYVLDKNNHKDVEIKDADEPTVVTFANEEMAELEILKVDADTGEKLAGATIRVALDDGSNSWDVYTNASGRATLTNLPSGTYTVTEIVAPEGYVLNKTPQSIKLEAGKSATITLENKSKPSLVIKKYDEDTAMPLPDAEFSVAIKGGKIIYEGMTDKSGQIRLDSLDLLKGKEGEWLTVTEIAAPKGYLIATESKDVYLEAGKTVEIKFDNRLRPSLQIMKIDAQTNEPLAGAKFKVMKTEDMTVSEYITDKTGTVVIRDLDEGVYTVEEIEAPSGYCIDVDSHKDIELEWGKTKTLIFSDTKKPTLIVSKTNALTEKGIPNTVFKIQRETESGGVLTLGTYKTDKNGQIIIKDTEPGWYVITETRPAQGFQLPSNPVTRKYLAPAENAYLEELENSNALEGENSLPNGNTQSKIKVTSGNDYSLGEEIPNYPLNSIVIKKVDANTSEMLAGAVFEIRKVSEDISGNSGTIIGKYTMDNSGIIVITGLDAGAYIIEEVKPPTNYLLSENSQQQAWLKADGTSIVEVTFSNYPYGSLLISKVDALTNQPLSNAKFKVTTGDGTAAGNSNGEYTTNTNGEIIVPNLKPDSYVVTELLAPQGYVKDTTPQTIKIGTDGGTYKVSFQNQPIGSLIILKKDYDSKKPLSGAKFKVTTSKGDVVGNSNGIYTTDSNGSITISGLEKDSYIIEEIEAPEGYALESQSRTIAIDYGKTYTEEFTNKKLTSLVIKKVDDITGVPLVGAKFSVEKQNGEYVGEYTTDKTGTINAPTLSPDWYIVRETEAPEGYILDETPKTVEVKTNVPTVVTFSNKPLSGIKIVKLDSVTRNPLEGVTFSISKMNGEKVGSFKTDKEGMIYVSNLEDGYYTVTETEGLESYHWDKEPKTVEVKSGKQTVLEVTNEPYSGLVIKKVSSRDDKPIEGVEFLVTKFNGEQVGYYKTDSSGLIVIEGLAEGAYLVKETKAAKGYQIDSEAKEVQIKDGKRTTLEVENDPLSSVLIRKIDSVTGEGIEGVKFLLYDGSNEPIGQFESDDEGYVWIRKELPEGKYKLREIEPREGYLPDDSVKTFYVQNGRTTEITWENTPEVGQIVITKRSSEFNELTGLPAGSPLSGAVFEVYNITGNLVDKITSDTRGVAASKGLPTGVYTIKEVSAPRYYGINDRTLIAEIRHNGDIVRFEVLNSSIMLNLTVQKKGPKQTSPGQTMDYEIYGVANESSGKLENFYIHDRIPTDATRVLKITTGTFSERMYYKITYKTNYRDYMTLADNLLTKNDYEYSLHPNVLGLQNGEYVTDVRLEFPQASPGFKQTKSMHMFCQVLPSVPKDYNITNRGDVGGRYGNEWESAKTSWNTTVWAVDMPAIKLPKTGY